MTVELARDVTVVIGAKGAGMSPYRQGDWMAKVVAAAGFFVAFKRAKQRVLFTYCPTPGQRQTILALY